MTRLPADGGTKPPLRRLASGPDVGGTPMSTPKRRRGDQGDPLQSALRDGGAYSVYRDDVDLLRRLGLRPFSRIGHGVPVELGTVELRWGDKPDEAPHAKVEVSVVCMPAQFWKFVVHRDLPGRDGGPETYRLSTGSGSLSDFWPAVLLVANGMLGLERA